MKLSEYWAKYVELQLPTDIKPEQLHLVKGVFYSGLSVMMNEVNGISTGKIGALEGVHLFRSFADELSEVRKEFKPEGEEH
jgi:hypothetical protein